jgi:glucokinase
MRLTAGVDIGATRLRVALGDDMGRILTKTSEPSSRRASTEALAAQVESCISQLLKEQGASGLRRLGLATTGPLDKRGGITDPANLPKVGFVPLVKPLQDALGGDVVLLNDCSAAALAEKEVGRGRGFDNFVYLTLSTGIGAGVFVDGHLLVGKDGNAHEVGHLVIDAGGRLLCGCGKPGHWEAYCSGRNMPRLSSLVLEGEDAHRVGALSSAGIFKLAKEGDEACGRVVREVGRLNAVGCASVTDAYDPELIVVGGSVALHNPEEMLEPIRKGIADYARNSAPQVLLTDLGEEAVLMGALLAALRVDGYPELRPWTFTDPNVTGKR